MKFYIKKKYNCYFTLVAILRGKMPKCLIRFIIEICKSEVTFYKLKNIPINHSIAGLRPGCKIYIKKEIIKANFYEYKGKYLIVSLVEKRFYIDSYFSLGPNYKVYEIPEDKILTKFYNLFFRKFYFVGKDEEIYFPIMDLSEQKLMLI
jgi:hypothetical protein